MVGVEEMINAGNLFFFVPTHVVSTAALGNRNEGVLPDTDVIATRLHFQGKTNP